MGLKPGYKQTEVGVIPEDWEVMSIGQIARIKTGPFGTLLKASEYSAEGVPVVSVGEIRQGFLRISDDTPRVSEVVTKRLPQYVLKAGDIVFGRKGGVDRSAHIRKEEDGWFLGSDGIAIRADEVHQPEFLAFQFQTSSVKNWLLQNSTGTTMPSLNQGVLSRVQIPIPSATDEQEAITEALSNADALIASLEQLLAKKRHFKQGAMQELLTGKKRLPGFSDKWGPRVFGEIVQPRKQRVDPRISGPHEFCIELEHVEQGTGHLAGYAATSEESSLKSVFQKNDVLFGKLRAYLRKYWLADREGVCSTEIWVLTANLSFLTPPFLFQIVKMDRFIDAASEAYGTHMPRSDWNVVKNYEVLLPPIEEQTAIAAVLTDMDAEIDTLETKLTKARQLKTGMMQELLTGRIRLVRPSASVVPFVVEQQAAVVPSKAHNPQINEAVVLAVLASKFGTEQYPLARVRRTKMMYLLHRHVEHQATGFLKKAAGPYNPQTRYGGPEKIALKNHYIRAHHNGTYEGFVPAGKIAQAEEYFEKWYGSSVMEWMEQFRHKRTDELELLTTIDMACEDLRREGKATSLPVVKYLLQSNAEWKAKLDKPVFSDQKIDAAIEICQRLFPPEGDTA